MKNLDGSLKNLLLSVQLTLPNCFVLKRVPHIWLFLTLLTLFSFQRTPSHCSATDPLSLQWIFSITRLLFYVNMLFLVFFTSSTGNSVIIPQFFSLCQRFFLNDVSDVDNNERKHL